MRLLLGEMKNNIKLNADERAYRSVLNYTGICLLIFLVLINVMAVPSAIVELLENIMPYEMYYTLSQITEIITYLASFIVPALILRRFLKRKGLLQPMNLEFRASGAAWLLVPGAIGINFGVSYLNSLLMSAFGLTDAYSDMVAMSEQPYEPYQILLLFLLIALVPAICEEFFFRGTILANLLPFGQGIAIIGSAVLFGLMHQNPYQLLYTTVAGLMMGYAYVKTRSIWYPTVIHLCNNSLAVLQEVIYTNGTEAMANAFVLVMNVIMMIVGFGCFAAYLVIDADKGKKKYDGGSFGRAIEPDEGYAQREVRPENKIRLFFSAGIIVFVVLVALSMLLLMAILGLLYAENGGTLSI
ncbi:MAG: CPBP family intramembrane metalloprotease [Ruminococcaceae bacterium]|nr:CPBP family intramembrane metalloprotease [Oscillospiraceae bacterium]